MSYTKIKIAIKAFLITWLINVILFNVLFQELSPHGITKIIFDAVLIVFFYRFLLSKSPKQESIPPKPVN